MKRLTAIALVLALLTALFAGCAREAPETTTEPTPERPALLAENIPDDNCRNWYEIFVYSFADSDGDRVGDLKGAAEKLDYVRDMGFTGIWLMPIMPSPSYHKYDITDYYAIDPLYGTLEDFQAFLNRAHELGIRVILDLVVNHTSNEHPWFQNAKTGADAQYRDYYNFTDTAASGYQQIGGSYYEARFVSSMPDLNLDNPAVRAEIVNIMKFWLDKGVDGFRLDAVTSYYTGQQAKNVEFLSWLNTEAKAIDPDCYIVGECWADESTIAGYYASGIDSFFCFPAAGGNGELCKLMAEEATDRGTAYGNLTAHLEERFGADTLMAPFLDNHDMDRITGTIGTYNLNRLKITYGLLAMMRGGTYIYYGDEIGMIGSGNDPNKRIGMYWSTLDQVTRCPPGTTESKYVLANVPDQQADANSLLNYVRSAMNLRNAVPEIARGTSEVVDTGNSSVCVIRRTWEGRTVTIVLNIADTPVDLTVEAGELLGTLDANVESGSGITFADGSLHLDPWGIAVLE